jgi:hypothetical protein
MLVSITPDFKLGHYPPLPLGMKDENASLSPTPPREMGCGTAAQPSFGRSQFIPPLNGHHRLASACRTPDWDRPNCLAI